MVAAVRRRIPQRFGPLVFAALMSLSMTFFVSGVLTALRVGANVHLPLEWAKSFATAWPVVFAAILVIGPRVRQLTNAIVE